MFLVPLLLLASTLHAGPERELIRPVPNASPYEQFATELVAGDEHALLVWSAPGVLAARIDRDGRRIDATPIRLSGSTSRAAVTRADGRWLAVWREEGWLVGRFVGDDGTAGALLRFAATTPDPWTIRVAFDGRHFLVTWLLLDRLEGVRLDARGNVAGAPFVVDATPRWIAQDLVAFESGFAVVAVQFRADDTSTVNAIRLDTNGNVVQHTWLDRTDVLPHSVDAIADGDRLLAVWGTSPYPGARPYMIFLAREGEPLQVLGTTSLAPRRVFRIGGRVAVLLRGDDSVQVLSEDGSLSRLWDLDNVTDADADTLGDRVLLATTDRPPQWFEHDVFTTALDASLHEVRPLERLVFAPAVQQNPAVARNAHHEALAVWIEYDSPAAKVLAMRLNAAGQPLSTEPIVLGETRSVFAGRPAVASDGTDYLVLWPEGAARVSRGGAVTEARPGRVPPNGCLAWTGSEYVAAYVWPTVVGGSRARYETRLMRLARDGATVEDRSVSPEGLNRQVDCAAGKTTTLVAWSTGNTLEAVQAGHGGTVSAVFRVGETAANAWPAVAANGDNFAVAWRSPAERLERVVVNEHGTVTPVLDAPIELRATPFNVADVAIAESRDGFVLAWGTFDLRAATLDAHGRVTSLLDLAATPAAEREIALTGGDWPLAVYMRELEPTPPAVTLSAWRVFARSLAPATPARGRAVRH